MDKNTAAPAQSGEPVACIAPGCHQWDGADTCTCQRLRGEHTLTPNVLSVLTNVAGILDVVKQEWSAAGSWSKYDQSVRNGITELLGKHYGLDAETINSMLAAPPAQTVQSGEPSYAPYGWVGKGNYWTQMESEAAKHHPMTLVYVPTNAAPQPAQPVEAGEASSVDLPPRVIDQLFQAAGVSTYHPDGDQQEKLHAFARNVVAETLARLPAAPSAVVLGDERAPSLPPLPDPVRTFADHSDRAYSRQQMIDYARAASPQPVEQTRALTELQSEIDRLNAIINTPHADDFLRAVSIEAEHQRQRWGSNSDAGKTPADWFWLVGYLAGKALHTHASGNAVKAEHHVITTAAALANWHRAMFGQTDMRPGIDGDAAMTAAQPALGAK